MVRFLTLLTLLASLASVNAAPAPTPVPDDASLISARASFGAVSALSTSAVSELTQIAQFASAAYCDSVSIRGTWTCGSACSAAGDVTVIDHGGDDDKIPGWFVVWSQRMGSLVVGIQGTNFLSIMSVLNNVEFVPVKLDAKLFPGVPTNVRAHSGWLRTQSYSAPQVLAAVKKGMATYKTNSVIVTGHSQGASLGTLTSLYLKLQIPSLNVRSRQFASPRVGNPDFATYFGNIIPDHHHITNKNDPVPHLPPLAFNFQHVAGEIFLPPTPDNLQGNKMVSCPGQENANCGLTNVLAWVPDHLGPYNGVLMGLCYD